MNTTAKDFEKFKDYCREWVEVFGLKDYHVTFRHFKNSSSHYGMALSNAERRTAKISLCMNWGNGIDVTDEELRRTALHECVHVVLNHLEELAGRRYTTFDEIDMAVEEVTVRMENAIYSLVEKRR